MVDQLTVTGLEIDDYEDRFTTVAASLRSSISAILDLSVDQPTGQLTRILLEHVQQFAELLQELHSAIDPDQATGQSLDAVSSITGTYRRAATHGTVALTLTFTGACTVFAGDIVAVVGDPDNQWIIDADVVGGAGAHAATATAELPGVVPAVAGTITVIVTPRANWSAVMNALDATAGLAVETDTELRLRREIEVLQGGSTTLGAIIAAVSALDGVLEVRGYENDRWYTQDGMPPKSVEIVYWAGATTPTAAATVAAIAETIHDEKASGIRAYGTDTDGVGTQEETVTDAYGTYLIGFTRAEDLRLELWYTLTRGTGYIGDAAFIAFIVGWITANLGIGDDVLYAKMIDIGFGDADFADSFGYDVVGVTNLTLQLRWFGGAWGVADLAVTGRQIATLQVADVTVT